MKIDNILNRLIKKLKRVKTREVKGNREINYITLRKMMQSNNMIKLIDVRSPQEFLEGRLDFSINIPLYELDKKAEQILNNKNDTIILYCQAGIRSKKAYKILKEKGYTDLYMLEGGLDNI